MKFAFTAARVANFRCPSGKKEDTAWDTRTPGLGLKARTSGSKVYIHDRRIPGRRSPQRTTIGDERTWTLDKAQAEARRLNLLYDQNKDPRQEGAEREAAAQATEEEAARKDTLVSDAWTVYLQQEVSKRTPKYYREHLALAQPGGEPRPRSKILTTRGPLADVLAMRLADLAPEYIAAWQERESQTRPAFAAYAYRALRAMGNWCDDASNGHPEFNGLIPQGAFTSRRVREAVPKPRAKDGDCLQREMLKPWFEQVRRIKNATIAAYLQGLLITGSRRNELAGLKWTDVDFEWRSLTIRDKVEGQRVIPLCPYLARLLAELKAANDTPPNVVKLRPIGDDSEQWKPSEWVFASATAEDGHLAEPRIAHDKALAMAGLPHVSLHGLRRSFKTLSEWVEVPIGVTAQIMGHKASALAEKHYTRRPLDLLRRWHDAIEKWILSEAGIEQPAVQQSGPQIAMAART